MIKILAIDKSSGISRSALRNYVYNAVHPLHEAYDLESIAFWFMESLAAIDQGIATLYAYLNREGVVASAVVLHPCASSKGAPHLHMLSVPKRYQSQGIGSDFLRSLLPRLSFDGNVSAECDSSVFQFFENSGFKLKYKSANTNNSFIHFGPNPDQDEFYRPEFLEAGFQFYLGEYLSHQDFIRSIRTNQV